jgi:hypothetical protein
MVFKHGVSTNAVKLPLPEGEGIFPIFHVNFQCFRKYGMARISPRAKNGSAAMDVTKLTGGRAVPVTFLLKLAMIRTI